MSESGPEYGIDYVEFGAADIEKTKQFYRPPSAGSSPITARTTRASTTGGSRAGSRPTPRPAVAGGALVVLYTGDLESALERVKSAGGTIVKEPFEFPGGRRFHFADPGGNELAVWSDGSTA